MGDTVGIASTLNNLGNLHRARGQWGQAQALFDEAVLWCDQHGLVAYRLFPLVNLGLVALAQGDEDRALCCLDAVAPQLADAAEPYLAAAAELARAHIANRRRQWLPAAAHLHVAVHSALALADLPLQLSAVVVYDEHLASVGQRDRAAAWLGFAARHRQAEAATRHEAQALADGLGMAQVAKPRGAGAARAGLRLQDLVRAMLDETAQTLAGQR